MTSPDSERVIGELELIHGLTIQMTAIGALGMIVGWTLFSGLYQAWVGESIGFQFVPASVGWVAPVLDILIIVFLGTAFLVPTCGFTSSPSGITAGSRDTASVLRTSSCYTRTRRPTTSSLAISSSSSC